MSEEKVRISNVEGAAMIVVAIFFDILSLLPVVGTLFALVFGVGTFALWFKLRGVGLINPRKVAVWGINGLAEAIPFLGTVWIGYTVGVVLMLLIVRAEDKVGVTVPLPGSVKTLRGGRSKARKVARRATQSPEHRREARRRLENIRRIQEENATKKARVVRPRSSVSGTRPQQQLV